MMGLDPGLWVFRAVLFAFGACMGSFLAAAAYRIPRKESLLSPSHCVHCGKKVPLLGLIPVLGVFLVRGRCAGCQSKVSYHYALVEAVAGVLTVLVIDVHVGSAELLALLTDPRSFGAGSPGPLRLAFAGPLVTSLWLLYTGLLLSLIDFEFRILPDVVTLSGIVVGLLLAGLDPGKGILFGLGGAAFGVGLLWAVAFSYEKIRGREGMGFGDVKYLGMLGAALGWMGVLWVLMIGSLAGSVVGLALGVFKALRARSEDQEGGILQVAIPFGPFLAGGAFVFSLFARELSDFLWLGTP